MTQVSRVSTSARTVRLLEIGCFDLSEIVVVHAVARVVGRAPPILLLAISACRSPSANAAAPGPGNARVDAVLGRAGYVLGRAGYIAGVPGLGIPGLRMADGPPGVLTRHPSQAETATMGVAATFDVRLIRQNGVVIGRDR